MVTVEAQPHCSLILHPCTRAPVYPRKLAAHDKLARPLVPVESRRARPDCLLMLRWERWDRWRGFKDKTARGLAISGRKGDGAGPAASRSTAGRMRAAEDAHRAAHHVATRGGPRDELRAQGVLHLPRRHAVRRRRVVERQRRHGRHSDVGDAAGRRVRCTLLLPPGAYLVHFSAQLEPFLTQTTP